jgi:hypothetical protein
MQSKVGHVLYKSKFELHVEGIELLYLSLVFRIFLDYSCHNQLSIMLK